MMTDVYIKLTKEYALFFTQITTLLFLAPLIMKKNLLSVSSTALLWSAHSQKWPN